MMMVVVVLEVRTAQIRQFRDETDAVWMCVEERCQLYWEQVAKDVLSCRHPNFD